VELIRVRGCSAFFELFFDVKSIMVKRHPTICIFVDPAIEITKVGENLLKPLKQLQPVSLPAKKNDKGNGKGRKSKKAFLWI
jgi:hypothetical protein